jgi:RNA polymerase sigma-70 factor (TIGR02943 family)
MNTEPGPDTANLPTAPPLSDPAFLQDLRARMIKFARLQLSDAALAEDAVQEALIGALANAGGFKGQAAFRTWVFAILKHKIADTLRSRARTVDASSLLKEGEAEEDLHELFNERGHWQADNRPQGWSLPEDSLHQQQFWRIFEACLEHLPAQQGRVFMMREFIGFDAQEVCDTVGLSTANLHQILYRARMRLRVCLTGKWFDDKGDTA